MRPHRIPLLLLAALSLAACGEGSPTAARTAVGAPVLAARGAAVEGSYLVVLNEGAATFGDAASSTIDGWIKTYATAGVVKNVPAGTANRLLYKAAL